MCDWVICRGPDRPASTLRACTDARASVLVLDDAEPRDYATYGMHRVLGHDGLDPTELCARGAAR